MSSWYSAGVLQPDSSIKVMRGARRNRLIGVFLAGRQDSQAPERNRGDTGKTALTSPRKNLTGIKLTQL